MHRWTVQDRYGYEIYLTAEPWVTRLAMNNKPDWLIEGEMTLNGHPITYNYDKEGDVLEIIFQKGGGLGIDLTENIVLRYNQEHQEPLSLIVTSFSRLTQPTPFGPPSFHLTALRTCFLKAVYLPGS
jgi:hypothetical protein